MRHLFKDKRHLFSERDALYYNTGQNLKSVRKRYKQCAKGTLKNEFCLLDA